MYYRVKLKRVETGNPWVTPYYFTSLKKASAEATFWDRFFGQKYDGISMRIWEAKVAKSKYRMGGILKTTPKKKRKKKRLTHSQRLKQVLRGKA